MPFLVPLLLGATVGARRAKGAPGWRPSPLSSGSRRGSPEGTEARGNASMESTAEGGPVNHRHQGQQDSAGLMEPQPERKPAGVQLEGCWRSPAAPSVPLHPTSWQISLPGEMHMQMMVLPPDEDGVGDDQPESESSPIRPLPSSSPSLSSSSLSLEEELSSSVELSAQHPMRAPERPTILTESRPLSINLNWRTCPSDKL